MCLLEWLKCSQIAVIPQDWLNLKGYRVAIVVGINVNEDT